MSVTDPPPPDAAGPAARPSPAEPVGGAPIIVGSSRPRRFLTVGIVLTALASVSGLLLLMSEATLGLPTLGLALLVAVVPLPVYLAAALWLDRYEAEPRWMLALAFLWGASVAVLGAGFLNAFADLIAGEEVGTILAAPVFEEAAKAVILFVLFVRRPDEFDGIVDGVVYASMVGLGFALMENIDYYGSALARDGLQGLAVTFTLRGIFAPFSHPLFTAMTGVGLGLARQFPRRGVRVLAPSAGLGSAIALHALWNAGAAGGCVFFAVYALVMLPVLAGLLALVAVALRREGRIIAARLATDVSAGRLTQDELQQLASVRSRMRESARAWARGGRRAWAVRRTFHQAGAELAFLRERAARDGRPADRSVEAAYLQQLEAARTWLQALPAREV